MTRLSLGNTLRLALTMLWRSAPLVVALSTLATFAGAILVSLVHPLMEHAGPLIASLDLFFEGSIGQMLVVPLVLGVLVPTFVWPRLYQRSPGVFVSSGWAVRRYLVVAGTGLAAGLVSILPLALGFMVIRSVVSGDHGTSVLSLFLLARFSIWNLVVGALAAMVVSLFFYLMLGLADIAVAAEEIGVAEGLRRSVALTRGHRLVIFVAFIVVSLIFYVLQWPVFWLLSYPLSWLNIEAVRIFAGAPNWLEPTSTAILMPGLHFWLFFQLEFAVITAVRCAVFVQTVPQSPIPALVPDILEDTDRAVAMRRRLRISFVLVIAAAALASAAPALWRYLHFRGIRDCRDCPEMVHIAGGTFKMGANVDGEFPVHEVRVPTFYMSKYPVTFEQWDACVAAHGCSRRADDRGFGRGRRPVINVTWNEAQEYVRWLSAKTGHEYRLPSEAEWEYAARAGTTTDYWWGAHEFGNHANCNGCGSKWDGKQTSPVGSFDPNPWGLYDMLGNVAQWTQDCYEDSYYDVPTDGSPREDCPDSQYRVSRGGSWRLGPWLMRASSRHYATPLSPSDWYGFRVAETDRKTLASGPQPPPPPTPRRDPHVVELGVWKTALATGTLEAYREYKNKYPNGVYVSLAEDQIAQLTQAIAAVPGASPTPPGSVSAMPAAPTQANGAPSLPDRFLYDNEWALSSDGRELAVVHHARPVLTADLDSGKVRRTSGPVAAPAHRSGAPQNYTFRLVNTVSPDLSSIFSPDVDPAVISTGAGAVRALASPGHLLGGPIGFLGDNRTFLYYEPYAPRTAGAQPQGGKLTAVDVESDRIVYSIVATKPEWLQNLPSGQTDGWCAQGPCLMQAMQHGAFSPDRSYFAYLFKGALHILDTASGNLDISELQAMDASSLRFSQEGDAVVVKASKWIFYDLRSRKADVREVPAGWVQNSSIEYFSARDKAIIVEGSANNSGRALLEVPIDNLNAPRWSFPLDDDSSQLRAVSANGQFALFSNNTYVDLRPLRSGAAPRYKHLNSRIRINRVNPVEVQGSYVIVVDSPRLEVLRVDLALDEPTSIHYVDFEGYEKERE